MSKVSNSARLCVVAACLALSACRSKPADSAPQYGAPRTANGALVGPLENDKAEHIVSWVDGQAVTDWPTEIAKRDRAIEGYLNDTDPKHAEQYGFRSGQNPQLAWDWFRNSPIGFGGVPYVLFKTILDLDPDSDNPTLRAIARVWKHEAIVPSGGSGGAAGKWTFDHIGIGPNPIDYVDGVARPADERERPLPFGLTYENPRTFEPLSKAQTVEYDNRLLARRVFKNTSLLLAKIRAVETEDNWDRDLPTFGKPGELDRVFFSCAACHQGRVMVAGKMRFLPGMPNTEIEAQYFSKLLMQTGALLVESGFDVTSTAPVNPANIKPNTAAIKALYAAMLDKARQQPQTLYGSSPAQIARAKIQAIAVADEFPKVIQDLIGVAVKTQFIYYVVARNNAYTRPLPDVLEDRPGQMDAFGIASGLVAIHTRRPDNSFLKFIQRDNPKSPFFTGFSKANGLPEDIPGMTDAVTDPKIAADRILQNISAWAPKVPAPIDIKAVGWALDRYLANWDGNQGAASRTLASGTSATGDPRMVNVRIHEPLNAFINNLPPPPYPFRSVDLGRAVEGKALYNTKCATCHTPRNQTIYPASKLGVDPNRSLLNTSVSRYGLAALVFEACRIYGLNNQGQPGAEWCVPKGDWAARTDEYFRDTPRRVAEGTNGYKADVLHGIWAQAPYLHNGSVPTLGQLLCPDTRPRQFLRGNLYYDEMLVGFEWHDRPTARYGPNDTILIKEYDTTVPGKANTGHTYGADLCPSTTGLDPIADRKTIEEGLTNSRIGALLAYLKTL
jgi:hypothetical protein